MVLWLCRFCLETMNRIAIIFTDRDIKLWKLFILNIPEKFDHTTQQVRGNGGPPQKDDLISLLRELMNVGRLELVGEF